MRGQTNKLGLVIGVIVLAAALVLALSGGELGGKKTIDGDDDLPPLATAER